MNPKTHDDEIWHEETRNSAYRMVRYFDILNRFSVMHECDRWTDRQTDRTAFNNSAVQRRALKIGADR